MNYIVYKVTFPNNKVYIGITTKSLEFRKNKHFSELKRNTNYKFHNALRKYKDTEIWEEFCYAFSWESAKELEKYFIIYFDSLNNGYNSTEGGDGILGFKFSEESKTKMRKPKANTENMKKPKSEEHKRKLSESKKGNKLTKVTKQLISKKIKIRNSSEDWQNSAAIKNGGKSFLVIEKQTNKHIGIWISQRKCARDLNLQQSHIIKCLKGKSLQHKGYLFIYTGENYASF